MPRKPQGNCTFMNSASGCICILTSRYKFKSIKSKKYVARHTYKDGFSCVLWTFTVSAMLLLRYCTVYILQKKALVDFFISVFRWKSHFQELWENGDMLATITFCSKTYFTFFCITFKKPKSIFYINIHITTE
jgi:hypothetical protein